MKSAGLPAFRDSLRQVAPFLGERVEEIKDWDQVKLLSVQINRLRTWFRIGLLCIGDAAHAMSPAGGVGINLAIQDAVATANILAQALRERCVTDALLAQVQERREFPGTSHPVLPGQSPQRLAEFPWPAAEGKSSVATARIYANPGLKRILGRGIGLGIRPEQFVRRWKKRLSAIPCRRYADIPTNVHSAVCDDSVCSFRLR